MAQSRRSYGGRWSVGLAAMLAASAPLRADTLVDGAAMALRSGGSVAGTAATLNENGYFGTYVRLDQAGAITFAASATGSASSDVNPSMTLSIADSSRSFSVAPGGTNAYTFTTTVLPAGTYFVRAQLDNHKTVLVNDTPVVAKTALTLGGLSVSANATVLNSGSDANAIAAADTYISHFRKGDAVVKLAGAAVGANVRVRLASNAFNVGTYVPGTSSNANDNYLAANPAAGTNAAYFQKFIDGRFNSIVPSNAGKWQYAEFINTNGVSSGVSMGPVDQMMAYAAAHKMTARQHNLLWGNQQPAQVKTWLTTATNTTATATQKAAAVASLQNAIARRVVYSIQGINNVDGKVRAADFQQLDVLNEALQTGNYYAALGPAGVAAVYKQVQDAVASKGLNVRLYANEYNVFQNSPTTITPSSTFGTQAAATYGDSYANWYRNEIETLNNAGLANGAKGDVVTGVGVQYYPTANGTKGPATIQQSVQNLSVLGLPISLTEFGGQTSITAAAAPQIVDDALRMMMGTPGVDSFMDWGWYDDGTAASNPYGGGTVLVNKSWVNADGSWNLTAAGRRFEYLFGRGVDLTAAGALADGSNPKPWSTDLSLLVGPDGTIQFNGFYGTYVVTVGGVDYDLTLTKGGAATFTLAVPEPASAAIAVAGLCLIRRPRHPSRTARRLLFSEESR